MQLWEEVNKSEYFTHSDSFSEEQKLAAQDCLFFPVCSMPECGRNSLASIKGPQIPGSIMYKALTREQVALPSLFCFFAFVLSSSISCRLAHSPILLPSGSRAPTDTCTRRHHLEEPRKPMVVEPRRPEMLRMVTVFAPISLGGSCLPTLPHLVPIPEWCVSVLVL